MMRPKAIITLCVGELYWEVGRFAPHIIYKRLKKYKDEDITFIICTRIDRVDCYGTIGNIFVPLRIKGDGEKYLANCYRLDGFSDTDYTNLCNALVNQFSKRYDIIETVFPKITKTEFANKKQYPSKELTYKYFPRPANLEIVKKNIKTNKKIVVIAPRYRKIAKRNWPHWQKLYDLIWLDPFLKNNFEFVLCGKNPDFVPDKQNRFIDINNFPINDDASLIGLTFEILKKSILTVGSQSGIPNISLLFGVEVLEWGHQKQYHTVDYNILNTKVTFLEDMKYSIRPEVIIDNMKNILRNKLK
jgi:hypothetical protein